MLRRVGIVAALVGSALVLSGCGADKEPAAVAVTPGAPVPSPSWTPPPAGMWTESDLAEGRKVPPEEMDRLRPLPEVPEEPETITHNTEQGAKDAAMYVADLYAAAAQHLDPNLVAVFDDPSCKNCADLRESIVAAKHEIPMPRCLQAAYEIAEIYEIPAEVPFYQIALRVPESNCYGYDLEKSVIKSHIASNEKLLWWEMQYVDGKWRPYYVALNGRVNYEED